MMPTTQRESPYVIKKCVLLLSDREQWSTEISMWLELPTHEIILCKPGASMPSMESHAVFVITYEGVVKLSAELRGKFKIIILDESHNIKNPAVRWLGIVHLPFHLFVLVSTLNR